MSISTITPSKAALSKARELAREAVKNDGWMTPCPEEHSGDLGEISYAHRDGWQGTGHFRSLYGEKLSLITDEEEELLGGLAPETRYFCLYLELLDAFWDEWETLSGFYELVEEA